ncbi:MAG: ISAs1 family transposase [Chloroflexota bacterium]|nr:ISAs1 family transposase [Chloroflexota bacterium]
MCQEKVSLRDHFDSLTDPRSGNALRHNFFDILVIALCAAVCGADSWNDVEDFGDAKRDWLQSFLTLPHGIPSHDTFNRVFAAINPDELGACFMAWTQAVATKTDGEVIAIDGKTLRRSYDRQSDKAALQMVSTWASHNRLVLGQVAVDETSNEITAIPRLLGLLEVSGCIVTIDAIGCQQDIAAQIVAQGGDYLLTVKANQGSLWQEAQDCFGTRTDAMAFYETEETGHGRHEIRRYWMTEALPVPLRQIQWKGLRSLGMVEATRTVNGKTSVERRYYISSLPANAARLAHAVRGHWGIENQVHWVLDMVFDEDHSRIRERHSAANFAMLRRMALNILRQDLTPKLSLRRKRLKAGWDNDYLKSLLNL